MQRSPLASRRRCPPLSPRLALRTRREGRRPGRAGCACRGAYSVRATPWVQKLPNPAASPRWSNFMRSGRQAANIAWRRRHQRRTVVRTRMVRPRCKVQKPLVHIPVDPHCALVEQVPHVPATQAWPPPHGGDRNRKRACARESPPQATYDSLPEAMSRGSTHMGQCEHGGSTVTVTRTLSAAPGALCASCLHRSATQPTPRRRRVAAHGSSSTAVLAPAPWRAARSPRRGVGACAGWTSPR